MARSAWRGRRLAVTAGLAAIGVAVVVALSASRRDGSAGEIPFATVRRGDLAIEIASVGELQAVRSLTFNVPRLKTNNVKVIWLVPEGARVAPGDTLARFDPTEVLRRLEELEGRITSARANLEKLHATQAARAAEMEAGLEDQRASLRLAELSAENVRYEARVNQEKAQLELQRARLGLQQAESKLVAQRAIDAAELAQEQVGLTSLLNQRISEREALANHAIVAATSGLAVYGSNWSAGRLNKIKIGDSVFPGAQVIELPDLSAMKVACKVNEARVQALKLDLPCEVRVDALADTLHHGVISRVNVLGRELEESDGVKVFDFDVRLLGHNGRLRPGMTANVLVRVDVLHDVLFAPIEAVQSDSAGTFVLRRRGGRGLERVGVEVGAQNDFHVALSRGVEAGDALALRRPDVAPAQ
jgi:multidrug efflux pump subunit AcrA (membrane-fusion protein)